MSYPHVQIPVRKLSAELPPAEPPPAELPADVRPAGAPADVLPKNAGGAEDGAG